MEIPDIFGLLSYHIDGDYALFHLARERYSRAGFGLEVHPGSQEHLQELFKFMPEMKPASVHLPYDAVLYNDHTDFIAGMVLSGGDKVKTYVLHDTMEYLNDAAKGIELLKKLDSLLAGTSHGRVCLEYAAGLPFDLFLEIINEISCLDNIGVCIDIGHVGIGAVKQDYQLKFPGQDVCSIKPSTSLSKEIYAEIASSVIAGRNKALEYIEELCRCGVYTHFHLHDGHPLSTFSPYSVCDHLPFYWEIPTMIPEIGSVGGMYGVSGLEEILRIAKNNLDVQMSSFTLEVHPQAGKSRIDEEFLAYFSDWNDLTNAQWMNYWIDIVIQNCLLVKNIWEKI